MPLTNKKYNKNTLFFSMTPLLESVGFSMNFKGRVLKSFLAHCVGLMVGSVSQLSSVSFGLFTCSALPTAGRNR